jgi:hypothetical protein
MAATTIRSVLLSAGIPPAGRRSELSWKQFLAAHAETLLAAATRRVVAASGTAQPTEAWVTQQARNLSWKLEEEGSKLSVVIRDWDKKFAPEADAVFKSEGA